MDISNIIVSVLSIIIAAVAGIYIPLYLHRESKKSDKDH